MADEEIKKPIIADPLAGASGTDTGALSALSDTQTRKTVKLKPIAKPDEHERKTVILKNIAGEIEKANVVETPESKDTIVLPAPEVKAVEAADDETVKIARPVIAKKQENVEPKTTLPPGVPQAKATIKLTPRPAEEKPADEPKAAAPAPEPVKPAPAAEEKKEEPEAPKMEFAFDAEPESGNSTAVTVMVALSAVLLCGAAIWAAVQYFE